MVCCTRNRHVDNNGRIEFLGIVSQIAVAGVDEVRRAVGGLAVSLVDVAEHVAVRTDALRGTGDTAGDRCGWDEPLQPARVEGSAQRRCAVCRAVNKPWSPPTADPHTQRDSAPADKCLHAPAAARES